MVPEYGPAVKRRKRRALSEAEVASFLRQYARKAPKRGEPNDRGYSRRTELKFKRMAPRELDDLLHGDDP